MGCLKFLGVLCSIFLYIFNGLLMIAGIVITVKGIYYLANAQEYSQQLLTKAFGIDELYREVGMSYVLPGAIMIIYSSFGLSGAGQKVASLVIYSAFTIMLMCANSYGISSMGSDNNKYSLYSYLNKVFISLELGQLSKVAYPEFGVQIALLLSSLFLIVVHYSEKKKKAGKVHLSLNEVETHYAQRVLQEARNAQYALLEAQRNQTSLSRQALVHDNELPTYN